MKMEYEEDSQLKANNKGDLESNTADAEETLIQGKGFNRDYDDENEIVQEKKHNDALEKIKDNFPEQYQERKERWERVKESIKFNKYQPNIVDFLIDNLSFSRYHLAILFTCVFSSMIEGYLFAYFKFSNRLILVKLSWIDSTLDILKSLILAFSAVGSFMSINSKTQDWDISSNALIAMMGFFCGIMTLIYSDTFVYILVFCLFGVCHGFIANISKNLLLEIFPTKFRGLAFLLVGSCRFLGIALCGAFIWYLNKQGINDPVFILFGFIMLQTLLTISLIFILDSPRVTFINQDGYYFVELIQEVNYDEYILDSKRKQIIIQLDEYKQRFIYDHGEQNSSAYFEEFITIFTQPTLQNLLKGIVLVSLIAVYMANITDIHYDLLLGNGHGTNYVFHQKNHELFVWGMWQFALCVALSFVYYFLEIRRIFLIILILLLNALFVILIPSLQAHYNTLIGFASVFIYFYFLLTYLYFSEYTMTKLRNATTSALFIFLSIALLAQIFMVRIMIHFYLFTTIIFNCFLLVFFAVFEIFLVYEDTKELGLHEIEVSLLRMKEKTI